MKLRWVTELRKKYEGKPIWISGSDPTLDGFPDGFERGKTLIALNTSYFKFPEATYTYSNEYFIVKRLLNECPEYGEKPHIFAWPLGWSGGNDRAKTEALLSRLPNVHWVYLKTYPPRGRRSDIHSKVGQNGMRAMARIAKMGKTTRFGGYGTCLHPCLMVAIMMGGNPINVIGCSHKVFGNRVHFGEDGKREAKGNYVPAWCPPKEIWKTDGGVPAHREEQMKFIRLGTTALVKGAAEMGITVNRINDYRAAKAFL